MPSVVARPAIAPPRLAVRLALAAGLLTLTAGLTIAAVAMLRPARLPPEQPSGQIGSMVDLPGGNYRMGNDLSPHHDERPAHAVSVGPFAMDAHEVTNQQFGEFVTATGYVTTAQERGWSLVLDRRTGQWRETLGADWQHPGGPDSTIMGRERLPVVHVSWFDARAYARWAGKDLPTEAQWEYAARAGLRDCDFPWGPEELIAGCYQANYRQEEYFAAGSPADGFDGPAPVMSFRPNRFGLFDLSGNVWEWCADWYEGDYYQSGAETDPRGPEVGHERVLRGGSWATAGGPSAGIAVWSRWRQRPEHTSDQVGFRCVR